MAARTLIPTALCAAVMAVASGCGDSAGPPPSSGRAAAPPPPADEDKRGIALACIRDRHGIEARPVGAKDIQVGPGEEGPRIVFFQSSLEAEARQFDGGGEGAEQIGAALLFVREAPEQQLIDLEECLNEQ
jgi:hypothetical protein